MKARELRKILRDLGCVEVRHSGGHLIVRCGECQAPIPVHPSRDIDQDLLRGIEKQFVRCLGAHWLRDYTKGRKVDE